MTNCPPLTFSIVVALIVVSQASLAWLSVKRLRVLLADQRDDTNTLFVFLVYNTSRTRSAEDSTLRDRIGGGRADDVIALRERYRQRSAVLMIVGVAIMFTSLHMAC